MLFPCAAPSSTLALVLLRKVRMRADILPFLPHQHVTSATSSRSKTSGLESLTSVPCVTDSNELNSDELGERLHI